MCLCVLVGGVVVGVFECVCVCLVGWMVCRVL